MAATRTLALVLLFALGTGLAAEAPVRRTDELMQKSGLWKQIGHFQGQIRAGIDDATGQDKEVVQQAARAAYAPDRMRQVVRADMERLLSVEDEAEVLVWLSSDLGERFTKLEEESEDPAGYTRMMREAPKLIAGLPPERMELLRRLERAVRGGEAGVEITINIAVAVTYGAASSSALGDSAAVDKLRAQIESQRPMMLETFKRQMVESSAWIYRSMSDEDLDRYAVFAETPAGRRYHAATVKALTNAFVRSSLDMGERIGRAATAEPRRGL